MPTHSFISCHLLLYLSLSPLSHSFACIQSSMPPLFAILTLETTFVICIGVCNFCCYWHFFLQLLLLLFVVQLLSLLLLVLLLLVVYICTLLYCIINKQNSSHVQPPLSLFLSLSDWMPTLLQFNFVSFFLFHHLSLSSYSLHCSPLYGLPLLSFVTIVNCCALQEMSHHKIEMQLFSYEAQHFPQLAIIFTQMSFTSPQKWAGTRGGWYKIVWATC